MGVEESRLRLDRDPSSVGEARRFLRSHLERWDADELEETATLLISEVVTNVVLHARTASELVLRFGADRLHVEVHDGSGLLPQGKRYGADATTGRGLGLLEALSTGWGAERTATGKYVWFQLDADAVAAGVTASLLSEVEQAELAELTDLVRPSAQGASRGGGAPATGAGTSQRGSRG